MEIQASEAMRGSILDLARHSNPLCRGQMVLKIAAGQQRATTGRLGIYGIFGAAPTSSHPDDVGLRPWLADLPRDFSSRGRSMKILGSGQPLRSGRTSVGIRAVSLGGFGPCGAALMTPDVPSYDGRKPLKVRLCLIEGSNTAPRWC